MRLSCVTDIPPVPALASHDKLGSKIAHISINDQSTNAEECPRCTPTEKWLSLSLEDPQVNNYFTQSTLCAVKTNELGRGLLFNQIINVKLKCSVFILSNIFPHSDILNFETNLFPIVPPAKINSGKSFNPK